MNLDGRPPTPEEAIARWICHVDGCGHDYSDVVRVIVLGGPGGPVAGFVQPLRCPSCRAVLLHARIVQVPGRQ